MTIFLFFINLLREEKKFQLIEMESRRSNPMAEEESSGLIAVRRIQRLSSHISPAVTPLPLVQTEVCSARSKKLEVNGQALSLYMKGKHMDIQEKIYEYFNSRPDLQTPIEISKEDHRELCMNQLRGLVREAGIRPLRYVTEDPAKYFAIVEAVGSVDMSLGIKLGVQYRFVVLLISRFEALYFLVLFSIKVLILFCILSSNV